MKSWKSIYDEWLKVHLSSETIFSNWNSVKDDEKYFLFHLKCSCHSQDIQILSWLFGHVAKRLDLKDKVNFKLDDVPAD